MPTADATRERVWVNADVPRDVNAKLAAISARHHRSVRAQVRLLIEQFVNEHDDEPQTGVYTGHAPRAGIA